MWKLLHKHISYYFKKERANNPKFSLEKCQTAKKRTDYSWWIMLQVIYCIL